MTCEWCNDEGKRPANFKGRGGLHHSDPSDAEIWEACGYCEAGRRQADQWAADTNETMLNSPAVKAVQRGE